MKFFPVFQRKTNRGRTFRPEHFFLARPVVAGIDNGALGRLPDAVPVGPSDHPDRRGIWNGAIAQLGERYNGIVEVSGSIPLSSTNRTKKPAIRRVFAFPDS